MQKKLTSTLDREKYKCYYIYRQQRGEPLAQSVEHLTFNQGVGGSIPPWLTNIAGWSSLVARQAHNLKVSGSNPLPATN